MLNRVVKRAFSASPYNPYRYLQGYVDTKMPSKQEIQEVVHTTHESGGQIVHNLRHINPLRQSGPVPPFDGPFTMEDHVKGVSNEYLKMNDLCYQSNCADEIMRRVPGITREEAEYVRTLGLTPDDEIEIAYWYKNIGLDMYYPLNNTYVARQVVTNSKGEKVEVLWPFSSWEDAGELSVDTAIQDLPYYTIRHWEAFSGDEWYKYQNSNDLGIPDTWFEYDKNSRFHMSIIEDQHDDLPDMYRPFPSIRNPNARQQMWMDPNKFARLKKMEDDDWVHRGADDTLTEDE